MKKLLIEITHRSILASDKIAKITAKRLRRNLRRQKSNYTTEEWEEIAAVRKIKRDS